MVAEFLGRKLEADYPIIMMDGMKVGDMAILVVLGIRDDGSKQMLGIIEGSSENYQVATALLSDIVRRGFASDVPRLFVLDGAKALHKSVKDSFEANATIQRCQVYKKRNVLSHLPKSEQTNVGLAISQAYLEFDYDIAKKELLLIAKNLEHRFHRLQTHSLRGSTKL